eukprot:scaffold29060_cov69-Phaeocystis_antarctica.AAC.3
MQRSPSQRQPQPIGSGSGAHLRQPAASQLVRDGQVGCCGRHPWASTWVRMVIIAPGQLGQSSGAVANKKSAQLGQVCGDIRSETIAKRTHPIN